MKKLNLVIATFLILSLSACQLAKFDRVPGFEQMAIPPQFQGNFILKPGAYSNLIGSDSIGLLIDGNSIRISNKSGTYSKTIRQDFQVSEYKGNYIIAVTDKIIPSLWNLFVIETNKENLYVYPLMDKRIASEEINLIGNYLPQQQVILSHDPISPLPNSNTLSIAGSDGSAAAPIVNPMGGMPSSITYFAVIDEQFQQLFNNEMKGKSFIQFSPVVKKPTSKKK
jgi:hypothetical protein